ncbi:MAG: type III pantothenate kinase [Dehalococcoidia bacterium]|nr:type III pantothenate kinase [Dehalococcoidia bacterium]
MLLAIGIGNTSIKLGVFDGDSLVVTFHVASVIHRLSDEYALTILGLLKLKDISPVQITEAALWCTVPSIAPSFDDLLQRYFNVRPLVVAAGVKTGIKIRMDSPREVGADRISNAVAAHALYGGPVIIADMGTATTFDIVSREGDYLGGAIAPGIVMAAEALFTRPAQLYRVPLNAPKKAIGTNTVSAMQSGLIYGYVAMVEGLVARFQGELPVLAKVIATGGYAPLIMQETGVLSVYNPDLSLMGLRIISQINTG